MKYAVFTGYIYYPGGGWSDYKGCFQTIEEALAHILTNTQGDWWHIVDLEKFEVVREGQRP